MARSHRRILLAAAVVLGAAVSGCSRSDARLEKLTMGIPKDSVVKLMGVEKPQRVDPYLVDGHYIETMYFQKKGDDPAKATDREMSPVVVVDGKLAGWGWGKWDSIATAHKIEVAK